MTKFLVRIGTPTDYYDIDFEADRFPMLDDGFWFFTASDSNGENPTRVHAIRAEHVVEISAAK